MKPIQSTLEQSDIEKLIGEPVSNFTISSGANVGDNVAGNLLAIKIATVSGKNLSIVYKTFPTDGGAEQREYVVKFGIFRTETCMYEIIFPRLQGLVDKRLETSLGKAHIKLPIAKYISGFNDDNNDYVCLEDLRPQGYKMQDKFNSLTLPEVSLVMREMAKLHSLTYFFIRYEGDKIFEEDERVRRIKYNSITVEDPVMTGMFAKMFASYFENTVELLEPRDKELAQQVRNFVENNDHKRLHSLQRFNHKRTDTKVFACIVHGDLWTNNILFKYAQENNRETPCQAKFIDFQLSRRGNIFEDLGYFFWTSTTPAFRKLHLISMLNEYYKAFESTLNQLQFPMPEGFSRGFLIDSFHEGILAAYAYMPFALSLQLGDITIQDQDNGNNSTFVGESETIRDEDTNGADVSQEAFSFSKMIESDKKLHKLRMLHSPRALDRLEDLTREIVEMKLLE